MRKLPYLFAGLMLFVTMASAEMTVNMHRPVSTVYDLYLGGIRVGELTLDAKFRGDSYEARSALRTAGIVGVVYDASFVAETEGKIGDNQLIPQHFSADAKAGGDAQEVDVTYAGRVPAEVRADPPFKPKPWEIDPRAQKGTLDPISAALTALAPTPAGDVCDRSVEIFDGRRRYAIDLAQPHPDETRIRCHAVFRRVAGYKPKELKETIEFDVWFEERPDGLAHLVRAAGDSGLGGLAVALLRE